MKRLSVIVLTTLFLAAGLTGYSFAQPDSGRPARGEKMARVRDKICEMRMEKLRDYLGLDEKTWARLAPLLERYREKKTEMRSALKDAMRELKRFLKEKNETQMKAILDKLDQVQRDLHDLNQQEREEMRKILTVEQQAKYVVFQKKFAREIKGKIREASGKRGPGCDRFENGQ
ncbi:MAG: hypothetical protein V1736_08070 [Pseudomonadota bacterium]